MRRAAGHLRPSNRGARQRRFHWLVASAALLGFVIAGLPGLSIYLVAILLLHVRSRNPKSVNVMEVLLTRHEDATARAWRAFATADHRRALAAPGRPPHRLLTIPCFLAILVMSVVLGARLGYGSTVTDVLARLGLAVAASTALWLACFGLSKRTPIILGANGVRIRESFVRYATVTGIDRRAGRVVLHRNPPLPDAVFETDEETAKQTVVVLELERERARHRVKGDVAPLPAAGFREPASLLGWRTRVDAAASGEERRAVLARVAPEELRALLDETADPSLEGDVRELLDARTIRRD